VLFLVTEGERKGELMNLELTAEEIETLLECLAYSQERIQAARDTPSVVRQENLQKIERLQANLREARRGE